MKNKTGLIINPIFLISLTLLFINDHFLKRLFPSVITGKISDFAGIFILCVFLVFILGKLINTKRSLILLHALVGLLFISLQIPEVLDISSIVFKRFGLPNLDLTSDITDLIALSILPFSFIYIIKFKENDKQHIYNHIIATFIIFSTGFTLLASSFVETIEILPNKAISFAQDEEKILYLFEKTLERNDFYITHQAVLESNSYLYRFQFDNNKTNYIGNYFHGELEISISTNKDSLIFNRFQIYSEFDTILDSTFTIDILNNRIINPFKQDVYEKNNDK